MFPDFYVKILVLKLMLLAFSRPGGFRELWEPGGNHFHLSWYLLVPVARSYGQKPWGGIFLIVYGMLILMHLNLGLFLVSHFKEHTGAQLTLWKGVLSTVLGFEKVPPRVFGHNSLPRRRRGTSMWKWLLPASRDLAKHSRTSGQSQKSLF